MAQSDATDNAGFTRISAKDNFYQTSAFVPMSFALVTTVHENGETGIGPHALLSPFGISAPHSMLLISRGNSGTAANIRRTGLCSLNYVEFNRSHLTAIATMGYPGQALLDKQKASPYALVLSPEATRANDQNAPRIVAEACQVMECSWDRSIDIDGQLPDHGDATAAHFVLRVENIWIKDEYASGIEDGQSFPSMPIFYGFRAGGEFWFAEHQQPFSVAAPKVQGQELQSVMYLANRIDEEIRFTPDACRQLTAVPRPFLKDVLKAIAAAARSLGITEIDESAMQTINAQRRQ